jgi:TetR/AcrR family transcriptional repressor of lmrAB and yxaGH operons
VLNRLTRVFRESGYAASLSQLSEATGLQRASLYHYFPGGKAEMAAAVIERSNRILEADIIAPLLAPGDPLKRLRGMARSLDRYFAGGTESCLLGALTLGGSPRGFAAHIEAGFAAWIAAIAVVLEQGGCAKREARIRAENAVFAVEGALLVCRGMGNAAPFRRLLRDLPGQLLSHQLAAA